jgi:DHA3 family macrolide efflux protein-like MFS transporter
MATNAPTTDAIPVPVPEPLSMGAVLRIPQMRRLWYAQVISSFGDFIALFAVMNLMTFTLKATPQQITGLQIAYMLPIAVLGVISGVFVDRWPIKRTLVSSDCIRAALCLLLIWVHTVWGFYVVMASISVISSVFTPAQGVAVRSAVPLHGIRAAQTLMQQVMFVSRIIGAPLASLLVKFTPASCFVLDSVSFVGSALLIFSVALVAGGAAMAAGAGAAGSAAAQTGLAKVRSDMQQGLSFILHHAGLLFVITAMGAAMFVLGCFAPLIAVYVRDILHAAQGTFGITSAMVGVGMMVGMNLLTTLAKGVKNTVLVYSGLAGIAGGTLILALLPHLSATIPGLLLIGFAVAAIIVPSQTLIQQETPQAMLGRVGSTVMSLIFSAQIAGLLLSGVLANHTSVRRVFAICTVMLAALIVAGKLWIEPREPAAGQGAAASA